MARTFLPTQELAAAARAATLRAAESTHISSATEAIAQQLEHAPAAAKIVSPDLPAELRYASQAERAAVEVNNGQALADTYDYVFVGSGTASSVTAVRLAKEGKKVLMLERGSDVQTLESLTPANHARVADVGSPQASIYDAHFGGETGDKMYVRGRGLAGSSNAYAMIGIKGGDEAWEAMRGLPGGERIWDTGVMDRIFTHQVERYQGAPVRHAIHNVGKALHIKALQNPGVGFEGHLAFRPPPAKLVLKDPMLRDILAQSWRVLIGEDVRAGVARAADEGGNPVTRGARAVGNTAGYAREQARHAVNGFNPNRDPDGGGVLLANVVADKKTLERSSVRNLLEETARELPDNLHLRTDALARRAIFDENGRAVAVEFALGRDLDEAGRMGREAVDPGPMYLVGVNEELGVGSGAIHAPQFMMLSGVGDERELARHGIQQLIDNPEVGKGLKDRLEVSVVAELPRDIDSIKGISLAPEPGNPLFQEWANGKDGLMANNGAVIHYYDPDTKTYILGVAGDFPDYHPGYSGEALNSRRFTWVVQRGITENQAGEIRLRSADFQDNPEILLNSFAEGSPSREADVAALTQGIEKVRKIIAALGGKELRPGAELQSAEELARGAKVNTWGHHIMGSNSRAIEGDLRYRGTENVRAIGADVFPEVAMRYPYVPTVQVGHRAFDLIKEAEEGRAAVADAVKKT